MSDDTKVCNDCKVEKPLTEFYSNGRSGYHPNCKPCFKKKNNERHKEYRRKNKAKIAEASKRWYENNREKAAANSRKQYLKNREKQLAKQKRLHREDKTRGRRRHLKYQYGITLEEFERMKSENGGGCAICKSDTDYLVVDHDHNTGQVRGVVCQACNIGMGNLKDDPELLLKAALYLERHVNR